MAQEQAKSTVVHSTTSASSHVYPDIDCIIHIWKCATVSDPTSVIVLFHGYGAHALYPTIRHAAETLAAAGHVCYSMDLPGHGSSPGVRGLVRDPSHLTDDGLIMAKFAQSRHPSLPLVLFGTSMGGAIALNVARRCDKDVNLPDIRTCVLCVPMLAIAQENIPPVWQVTALRLLSAVAPSLAVLGFRDPVRREECTQDELSYKGNLRLATACSCMDTATELSANLHEVTCPFLCLVAGKEAVVDRDAYVKLMELSATEPHHKKAVLYPEALHGLFCEPPEERALIEKEIVEWLNKYTGSEQ